MLSQGHEQEESGGLQRDELFLVERGAYYPSRCKVKEEGEEGIEEASDD